jgi:hypothetical protein|tara:strand:+ start:287 stop:544 length:258 start_codon:yes stop_codon:yes gene_type:complete
MDKKEKYFNYVVNDLIKRSDINYVDKEVTFPFDSTFSPVNYRIFLLRSKSSNSFSSHVITRYGLNDDEVEMLWNIFRFRFRGLSI